MARIWSCDGMNREDLAAGWTLASVAPGSVSRPSDLPAANLQWLEAQVPGTVASALRQAKAAGVEQQNFDDHDFWFCRDSVLPEHSSVRVSFEGLATRADVYWDDQLLVQSASMFLEQQIDMAGLPRSGRLSIHFKSLNQELALKRPRPRWRTRLVERQQLRWIRTTLLGRIPSWSSSHASVGPYRPVVLVTKDLVVIDAADIRASLCGDHGLVQAKIEMQARPGQEILHAVLMVNDQRLSLDLKHGPSGQMVAEGALRVLSPRLWWPHTHGEQALYQVKVLLDLGGTTVQVDLGQVGFRSIALNQEDGGFGLEVNGVPVFCRGACWTPPDVLSLGGSDAELRPTLLAARDAGMNMIRVGGTMIYESHAFYQLCDELGILIWQDFMFANMDYPVADAAFAHLVRTEAEQFLDRVQTSPCLVVLCGSSEVEQQAAMLGLGKELWTNEFFAQTLPELCAKFRPDVPYWPSSPSGGVLPFQVDSGVSHYYGVGAYLRPLEDARRSDVRFTSECLGFSNVPDEVTIDAFMPDGQAPGHHPVWKERVPRDSGAGWDFEDVRDHYMRSLFKVDPMALRYSDPARYLQLARVTTGEVIAATLGEWRRFGSRCRGALLWFLRDLRLGAGWGLIDASGRPKAAYYYARRSMQALALFISDEGLNGLVVHAVNESAEPYHGRLELSLYRHGEVRTATATKAVTIAPRSTLAVRADAIFEHFLDTAYAYRFGPAGHDLAVAAMRLEGAERPQVEAFHFPLGFGNVKHGDLDVEAKACQDAAGDWWLTIRSRKLAQSVAIDVQGFALEDHFFHVAPGGEKTLRLRPLGSHTKPSGSVLPLNARQETKIIWTQAAKDQAGGAS